jgi:hypothetical protein
MDDSARRLPWTCFSMVQNKGIVNTNSNLDNYLLFEKRIIVKVLKNHPIAKEQIPVVIKLRNINRWFRAGINFFLASGAPWTA